MKILKWIIFMIFIFLFANQSSCEMENDEEYLFKKIYVINLKRRGDRKEKMLERLKKYIGDKIDYTFLEAVDGSELTKEWMSENNYSASIEYRDPFHGRILTRGEIGCMISHIKGKKKKFFF
jgi:GR25 family glycosyltransferase involved in LPS biosynthesis